MLPLLAFSVFLSCTRPPTSIGVDMRAYVDAMEGAWFNDEAEIFIAIRDLGGEPQIEVYSMNRPVLTGQDVLLAPDGSVRFSIGDGDVRDFFVVSRVDRQRLRLQASRATSSRVDALILEPMEEGTDLRAYIEEQNTLFKENEVPAYVDGIKTAEIAYNAAFDVFVPAPVNPRPIDALTPEAVSWDYNEAEGFNKIGWSPDGKVYGTYRVDVSADGSDFTIHGWVDLDGDGVPAHWTATLNQNATRRTPPEVR